MSSNDIILIDIKQLTAYHESIETDKLSNVIAKTDNLNDLIEKVMDYQDNEPYSVEYGIRFIN